MKNTSDIQPDTLHADTQGQATPVFALAYLLGIVKNRFARLTPLAFAFVNYPGISSAS